MRKTKARPERPSKIKWHRLLGFSRPAGEYPHHCSKCLCEIPEGAVPLMVWGDALRTNGHVPMWVYCSACDFEMYGYLTAKLDTR
jgi:hypothetical protein